MAKPLTPLEQKQLSAFLEIIPNRSVHLVQEALETGYYRGVSLYDAQRTLLSHEGFREFGEEFAIHGSYNQETFERFLDRVRTDPRGLYDRIKRSVWSNDLDILDPSKPAQPPVKAASGELVPAHPIADQPPPPPSSSTDSAQKKEEPKEEAKKTPETPEQEEETVTKQEQRPPEQPQQRLDQANRSMQRTQRSLSSQRQTPDGQVTSELQPSERMERRLSAANRSLRRSDAEEAPLRSRARAGRSVRISRDNRRRALPLRGTTPPASGGLFKALDNYLLAKDALGLARWLADKLGFTRLANLLGRLNNFLGLPGNWLAQGLRGLWNGGAGLGRAALEGLARGAINLAPRLGVQAALTGGRLLVVAVVANPFTWLITGIIIVFTLVMWWAGIMDRASNNECDKPGKVEVLKTLKGGVLDGEVKNGENIEYEIVLVYNIRCVRAFADIEVTDVLPANTTFVSSSAKVNRLSTDPLATETEESLAQSQGVRRGNTVVWRLKNVLPERDSVLSLVVTPNEAANDTWVMNEVLVNFTETREGGGAAVSTGANVPPTQDNCNGKYKLGNPLGNFGDPLCDFNEDLLYTQLQQIDPANAKYWFDVVIKCESSYIPNAWADHAVVGTPDAGGAWGLVQMGRGKNGEYDHGDVVWQSQVSNAINYNNNLANKWRYWACARDRW